MSDGQSYGNICEGEFGIMPNVLSIFSGGGGIDCGFKKAGFTICFSTDLWKGIAMGITLSRSPEARLRG